MALFKPGVLVQTVSGNIGGVCFVQGKGGAYVRARGVKINQATSGQLRQRARFQSLLPKWAGLDDLERQTWQWTAARVYRTDRLGVQKPWPARSLFLSENALRITNGMAVYWYAPQDPVRLGFSSFVVTYASGVLTLRCNRHGSTGTGRAWFMAARSFSTSGFRAKYFYGFLSSPFTTNLVVNGTSFFTGRFGAPQVGEYLAFRVVALFERKLSGPPQELIIRRAS